MSQYTFSNLVEQGRPREHYGARNGRERRGKKSHITFSKLVFTVYRFCTMYFILVIKTIQLMYVKIVVLRAVQIALCADAIKCLKVKSSVTSSNYSALKG